MRLPAGEGRIAQDRQDRRAAGPALDRNARCVATLGAEKTPQQWLVGFALETEDQRFRALVKLERKHCDLMVLNGPGAMNAEQTQVEIMDRAGQILAAISGDKGQVGAEILRIVQGLLVERR